MCGILGFNWKDEALAEKLAKLIRHRGPDQEGFYFCDKLSLAHRRLSILDLSENGRQPMSDEGGELTIVFNGEIFNFQELRSELESKGHKFFSKSDTEVLLSGYKEYGENILEKLNGQFAFAIFDKAASKLFLARDRAGINPLYYYFKDGKFVFGSELKVVLESGVEKKVCQKAVDYYLMYGHTGRRQSILEDCFKLEAGSFLVFDLKENKISKESRYWQLEPSVKIIDEAEAAKSVLEGLEKAVAMRMVADVPVGAFLSGGVDSSAVVAMMSRHTDKLKTFSVSFDHDDFDEASYAELVSKKFGTDHHVVKFKAEDVKDLVPELAFHYDEPLADPSAIPTFLVSRVARRDVVVSLSGDGGDELFGGYESYNMYGAVCRQSKWPLIANKSLVLFFKALKRPRAAKFFSLAARRDGLAFAEFRGLFYAGEYQSLARGKAEDVFKEYASSFCAGTPLEQGVNCDFHNYLVDDVLAKVDRASLGNSLESRPPLLDHNLIELAFSLSSELKIKNGQTKYIFKKALEGILPDEIIHRRKQGFSVPLKYYLKNELKDLVKKYVFDYSAHDFYKQDFLKSIRAEFESGHWRRDYSRPIWAILMFNLWHERWILGKEIEVK
jgi:asparagine synthase (glutamine-hydrolysing)